MNQQALLDRWYRFHSGWISPECVGRLSERRIVILAGQVIHIATPCSGVCSYENSKWAIEQFLKAVGLHDFAVVELGTRYAPSTPYKKRPTMYSVPDPRYFSELAIGSTWVKWKLSKFMEWVVDGPPIPSVTDGPVGTWCVIKEHEAFGSNEKTRVFHALNAMHIDRNLYSGRRKVNETDVIDMMANALRLQTKGISNTTLKNLQSCNR